jgi:hypothetical protein
MLDVIMLSFKMLRKLFVIILSVDLQIAIMFGITMLSEIYTECHSTEHYFAKYRYA